MPCAHRLTERVQGTGARVIETRKTVPGLRVLDKWGVLAGGGANHRIGLFDMVMIKDNHVTAAGGITAALTRTKVSWGCVFCRARIDRHSRVMPRDVSHSFIHSYSQW